MTERPMNKRLDRDAAIRHLANAIADVSLDLPALALANLQKAQACLERLAASADVSPVHTTPRAHFERKWDV